MSIRMDTMMMNNSHKPFRSNGGVATSTSPAMTLMQSTEGPVAAQFDNVENPGVASLPIEHRFSPYQFNGGTVAAVAGPDYCILACDTRLSAGFEILSRQVSKLHSLTDTCVLASSGCKTDVDQLRSVLDIRMKVRFLGGMHVASECVCVLLLGRALGNSLARKVLALSPWRSFFWL